MVAAMPSNMMRIRVAEPGAVPPVSGRACSVSTGSMSGGGGGAPRAPTATVAGSALMPAQTMTPSG